MKNYLLILFVSYLGLTIGSIISNFTKEELNPERKYFLIGKTMVFSAILLIFMLHLDIGLFITIPSVMITGFFSHVWNRRIVAVNTDIFFYSFFAVILFDMRKNEIMPVVASLIFFYGLLSSAVKFNEFWNSVKKSILDNLIYIILGIALFIMFRT